MTLKKDLEQCRQTAQKAVDLARRMGADTVVAKISMQTEFEIEVRNGETENLSEADSHIITITLSKDKRRASVQSSDTSDSGLKSIAEQALAMARFTDQDPYYSLPDQERQVQEIKDLDLYDETILHWPVERRRQKVMELEKEFIARDPKLNSDGAFLSNAVYASAMANSQGLCVGYCGTLAGAGVSGFAQDEIAEGDLNTGRKQSGGWSSRAHYLEDLEAPSHIAQKAATNVLRKIGGRKPKSGEFPVYFEPSTALSIWNHLLSAIEGSALYRNESFLVGKLGEKVCASGITIFDEPHLSRGLGSRPYDSEGVACTRSPIVVEGVLQTYMLGTYSANKLGMKSTGHAGGAGNILIQPGQLDEQALLKEIGTGIWVTNLLGQGANISTGDYSRGAQGLWIENGEVAYPVMEFTINSNLATMLQSITHLGNNVEKRWSVQTPGFVMQNLSISGM